MVSSSLIKIEDVVIRSPKTENDFLNYYRLRWEVLRKPWGQPKGSEKDDNESAFFHLMAEVSSEMVGVGCIYKIENDVMQVRFMAISQEYNQNGIGRLILRELEDYAERNNTEKIKLYAREVAVPFYLKSEYKIVRDGYTLFGTIKHKLMEKRLKPQNSNRQS